MSHFMSSDDEYLHLLYGDDYRAYLMARSQSADGYRFGRTQAKRGRVRTRNALRHVTGFFRSMIEAIANSKLRRLERELALRGVRYDGLDNDWVAPKSRPSER